MTVKKLSAALLLTGFLLQTLIASAKPYDPTEDLLFAFGSKCHGVGAINQTAFSDGAAIKNIIQSIRADENCKGVTGALNDIDSLNVPGLLRDRVADQDMEYLSVQAGDIELALQSESETPGPDKEYIQALKKELISIKVGIAKSKKLSNQERTRNKLETIGNFQKYSSVLFARLKQSDQCLNQNPNLAASIGAQVLGLGSTLASGVVGSLMLATGSMIDSFVSFFKDRGLGNKMKGIVNSKLGPALGCSFEGLAKTYCQARDIEAIIHFNKNKAETKGVPSWLDGVGAIGQDSASYMAWVTQVDAGSPAGTSGRATDKKSGITAQAELRTIKIDLDGILNNSKNTVSLSPDKQGAVRQALNEMAGKMTGKIDFTTGSTNPVNGPFSQSFAGDPQCGPFIYLYSKGVDRVRKDAGTLTCATYVTSQYPNLPNIETEVGSLIEALTIEASSNVNVKLSLVNESNPMLVVAKVDSKFKNQRSARDFMNTSIAYLENLLKEPQGIAKRRNQRDLIEKTKNQLIAALSIIDRSEETAMPTVPPIPSSAPSSPVRKPTIALGKPADPVKKVADLSRELIPQGDTFAIPKALSEIINQDIDHKISQGEIDQNLAVLMQLSATDSLGELIKYYIGLEPARSQARSAKELSKDNISAIAATFSEGLQQRFEKLSREASNDPAAKDSLALLCMQSLAIPEAPHLADLDLTKYCSGNVYSDDAVGRPALKMDFNELIGKSYPERACAVHDFYRKSYLYDLKNKNRSDNKSSDGVR
ncbi:MAG: hypothetical protein H7326_07020 [Bdellovibrionaceae bacterium]|nr:hypothetical protein [Pseudobdellovibrionaceae bacterium]